MVAMQALGALVADNQDRGNYEMTFTFQSDQDETWVESFTLDQSNWFTQRVIDVSFNNVCDYLANSVCFRL